MKKIISFLCVCFLFMLSSCSLSTNGIEAFGDVEFVGEQSTLFSDTTYFMVNGKKYVQVGQAEDNLEKKEYIAAIHGVDKYSYQFYTLEDDSKDVLLVHAVSRVNLASFHMIYVSQDVISISVDLLFEFPYKDTWWNGGLEKTIQEKTYVCYGSAKEGLTKGEFYATVDGVDYYKLNCHEGWLCATNQSREDMLDVYYSNSDIKLLATDIIWAVHTY